MTRQKCAGKWCATFWARVSNFLSHRKVKSLTFRIYGKFESQCARNGPQNPPFCPGPVQDTFIIYSSISHQHIVRTYFATKRNLENQKPGNLKIQKVEFLMPCQTKSRENLCLCVRTVRAVTLDTPRPHKYHLK